jgi:uncharacterized membrane protein
MLMCAIAYTILVLALIEYHGTNSALAKAIGSDFKGKISLLLYTIGIAMAFFNTWLALGLYATVSIIWFIPDRRIEKVLKT